MSTSKPGESDFRWPQPGELWSLWDIMIKYEIEEFMDLGQTLHEARSAYLHGKIEGYLESGSSVDVSNAIAAMAKIAGRLHFRSLENMLAKYIKDVPFSIEGYDILTDAFNSQVQNAILFLVPADRQEYFEDNAPFGVVVRRCFPTLMDEIDSARLCLGYGQPTACVFHLMRVMEGAVAVLGAQMGLSNVEKEWGKILSDIDDKIKLMPKDDDKHKWSEARSNLWHVKECWRNKTMHPRRNYTQAQAVEIFGAVGAFMRALAKLTPEGNTAVSRVLRQALDGDDE